MIQGGNVLGGFATGAQPPEYQPIRAIARLSGATPALVIRTTEAMA